MARVQLTAAHVIGHKKYRAGTIIADSAGAAQAGDVIWTGLNANTFTGAMVALDAGATTIKNASPYRWGLVTPYPDGVNSIDA